MGTVGRLEQLLSLIPSLHCDLEHSHNIELCDNTHPSPISGACSQFALSYPPMGSYLCPGSSITYTCVLSSSSAGAVNTVWKGSAFQCPATVNQLILIQKSAGVLNPTAGGQCGNLSAVTTNISNDGTCYTSVLTIPAVQALNGTTVMCVDGVSLAVVGKDTVNVKMTGGDFLIIILVANTMYIDCHSKCKSVPGTCTCCTCRFILPSLLPLPASPGLVGTIKVSSPSVDQLTVAWAPPTTGGVPTSYNVSINDSNSPVVIPDNGSSLYTHTFTGLTSDTLYTVSVVAINCAGTSNGVLTSRRTCKCII